jgi:hypothetical protein
MVHKILLYKPNRINFKKKEEPPIKEEPSIKEEPLIKKHPPIKEEPLKKEKPQKKEENPLIVKAFPTSKSKVRVNDAMTNHLIPKHPFRAILSGYSGSGKTNLLIHLLNKEGLYKNYFDFIFIISPTAGKLDDAYNILAEHNTKTSIRIINELDPTIIDKIMTKNKEIILKKKVHKAPKILIVYDDVISDGPFMRSKAFTHSFIASRHYNASVIICTQKYNAVPRVARIQANAIFFFRGTNSEREVLAIDRAPSGYSRREMESLIDYATTATESMPYPFLYINLQAKREDQLRKSLDQSMKLLK